MNIDTLRLFVEVAHKLSFAAVAEDRQVNPSSVSRVIGQLEDELGVRLFQRTTRQMAMTEGGAVFFRRISEILDEIEQAHEQARLTNAGPMGTLRLTASVAFGERVIVPLVADFRAAYPDVKLELLFTDANLDLVSTGIDLAIRLGSRLEGDIVASRLFSTRYKVVASPAYLTDAPPLRRPGDLEKHRCVAIALPGFRTAWQFRRRKARAKSEGVDITVPISGDIVVSSALSLRSLVLGGAGPALMANWLVDKDIEDGRLIDLFPKYETSAGDFDTAAWVLYPSRSYLPQKVRVAIDFLRNRLGSQ